MTPCVAGVNVMQRFSAVLWSHFLCKSMNLQMYSMKMKQVIILTNTTDLFSELRYLLPFWQLLSTLATVFGMSRRSVEPDISLDGLFFMLCWIRFLFVLTLNQFWVVPKVSEVNHCYVTLMSFWMILIFYLKSGITTTLEDFLRNDGYVIKQHCFWESPAFSKGRPSHTWWQIIQCIHIGQTLTPWQKSAF